MVNPVDGQQQQSLMSAWGAKIGVQSLVSAKRLGTYSCPPPQHHQPTRVDDGAVVGGRLISQNVYSVAANLA